jgi:hypothetical protein
MPLEAQRGSRSIAPLGINVGMDESSGNNNAEVGGHCLSRKYFTLVVWDTNGLIYLFYFMPSL